MLIRVLCKPPSTGENLSSDMNVRCWLQFQVENDDTSHIFSLGLRRLVNISREFIKWTSWLSDLMKEKTDDGDATEDVGDEQFQLNFYRSKHTVVSWLSEVGWLNVILRIVFRKKTFVNRLCTANKNKSINWFDQVMQLP